MFEGANLQKLTMPKEDEIDIIDGDQIDMLEEIEPIVHLQDPKDCLAVIQCNPPSINCCTGQCDVCGDVEVLKSKLKEVFDRNKIDEIHYKK